MLNKKVLDTIKNSNDEYILNCEFCGKHAFLIRNGKYIVMTINGIEWEFDKFEQCCYFIVVMDKAVVNKESQNQYYNEALEL